jgi:hypothetical protein
MDFSDTRIAGKRPGHNRSPADSLRPRKERAILTEHGFLHAGGRPVRSFTDLRPPKAGSPRPGRAGGSPLVIRFRPGPAPACSEMPRQIPRRATFRGASRSTLNASREVLPNERSSRQHGALARMSQGCELMTAEREKEQARTFAGMELAMRDRGSKASPL